MKTYKKLALPALAAMMMLSPAFYQESSASLQNVAITRAPAQAEKVIIDDTDDTYVNVEVALEKKDDESTKVEAEQNQDEDSVEVAQTRRPIEKVELLKIEPVGIKPIEIKLDPPTIDLSRLPAIQTITSTTDEEVEEVSEEVVVSEEDKEEEVVVSEEDKEEEVVASEEDKEEEVVASEEVQAPSQNSSFEELTGLVCKQQNQIERMTASIDTLVQNMNSQMQLMQTMTQLMMMQQMASSFTPTYQSAPYNPMIDGFQAFVYGQRMGSLMNIFSPLPNLNFGVNAQAPQAPVYNYNITGDFYGRDYNTFPGAQAFPQANLGQPMNNMMMSPNINWMDDSNRMAPFNSPTAFSI